jgi:hypothetical protein
MQPTGQELSLMLEAAARSALSAAAKRDMDRTKECLILLSAYDSEQVPVLPGAIIIWVDVLVEHLTGLPAALGRMALQHNRSSRVANTATGEWFASGSAAFDMELAAPVRTAVEVIDSVIDERPGRFWELVNAGYTAGQWVDIVFSVLQIIAGTVSSKEPGLIVRGE